MTHGIMEVGELRVMSDDGLSSDSWKYDEIIKKDGDVTKTGVMTFASPPIVDGNAVSTGQRKNYLINGNFDMWQYGTSQTTNGYGSDDRWTNNNTGSTKTHSRVTCTDTERALFNASYFSRTVVSSVAGAGNLCLKAQRIEGVASTSNKTITLSFLARADSNKNIAIECFQYFGTGGAPSATVTGISSQLIALTSTLTKYTVTITAPSIIGKTIGTDNNSYISILFWFDAGSDYNSRTASLGQQSGTFDIAQVKLEDGSVATEGWHPYDGEFGGEVQACQRYTFPLAGICIGQALNTVLCYASFPLSVKMRATPSLSTQTGFTVTAASGSTLNCTAVSLASVNSTTAYLSATVAAGLVAGNATIMATGASAYLTAEL